MDGPRADRTSAGKKTTIKITTIKITIKIANVDDHRSNLRSLAP